MIRHRIGFPTRPSSSPRSTDVLVPVAGTVGTPQAKSLSSWLRSPITQGYADQETRDLVSPYRQVGWINAAIRLKEQSMARLKLEWRVDEKPDSPIVTSGEVVDLWGRINPMMSLADLHMRIVQWLELSGECFLFFTDRSGKPLRVFGQREAATIATPYYVWPLRGGRRRVQVEADKGVAGMPVTWIFPRRAGPPLRVPAESVLLLKYPDPDDVLRGLGPIEAVWGAAVQDYVAQWHAIRMLKRGGAGKPVIQFKEVLSDTEYGQIREEIDREWDSRDAAGKTRILHGGGEVKDMARLPEEIGYGSLRAASRKDISAVEGVPESLLGGGADVANYATFAGDWKKFWAITMHGIAHLVADALNQRWARRLNDQRAAKMRCSYSFEGIEELEDDLAKRATGAAGLQKMGVPLNYALKLAKISADPIEGGDVPLIPGRWQLLEDAGTELGLQLTENDSGQDPAEDAAAAADKGVRTRLPAPATKPAAPAPPSAPPPTEARTADEAAPPGDSPARPAPSSDPAPSDADAALRRRTLHKALERVREKGDRRISARYRKWLGKVKTAQLELLRKVAASAPTDEGRAVPLYAAPPPRIAAAALDSLLDASVQDWREERDLDRQRSPLLMRSVLDCSGRSVTRVQIDWTPRIARWAEQHAELIARTDGGLRRLRDLALLAKAELSEAEFDEIIIVNRQKWIDQLRAALRSPYAEVFEDAIKRLAVEAGLELTMGATDPRMLDFLRTKAIRVSEGVTSTLARQLRTTLANALTDAESVGSLAGLIRENLAALQDGTRDFFARAQRRAVLIARTETAQISNTARFRQMQEWDDEGLLDDREWAAAGDGTAPAGRTRPTHDTLDGTRAGVDEFFVTTTGVQLRHPCDPNAPPEEIIGCRCIEIANVSAEG